MNSTKSFRRIAVNGSARPRSFRACASALVLAFTLGVVACTGEVEPAATGAQESAGEAQWDRRDFNGIWHLTSYDTHRDSTSDTAASQSEPEVIDEWGFGTYPQLKGKYLQDYQERREADRKAGRNFLVTCKPNGIPALLVGPYATEILQNEKQINWFQEFPGETWRIYLDGRPHLDPEAYPATLTGHSTGKWEGDTLVVDTVNIRTDTLLFGQGRSTNGLGHSEKMHIVMQMRLIDAEHLQVNATVKDPEALVQPWQFTLTYHRHPGEEIVEYLCDDNNTERLDPLTGREITEIPQRRNQPNSPPE
jgi:hypothetical protein